MRRMLLTFSASMILSGSLLIPAYSNGGGEPHPLIRRAVNALTAAKNDLQNAAEGLAADPHSPLALQQLVLVQQKLNNDEGIEASINRLKYQRAPTVEWFLVWHPVAAAGVSAAN